MRVEILRQANMVTKGTRMLDALAAAIGDGCVVTDRYRGRSHVLMTYGVGDEYRAGVWKQHRATGGRCVGWDLGYWRRDVMMRLQIDALHPHALIRPEAPGRWDAERIALRQDADPRGPVVLVGLGIKSADMLGLDPLQWERKALARIRRDFPGREVIFKPKRPTVARLPGTDYRDGPIEPILRGASLVVCRHSNAAVDACIAGVPVVCDDGAALALYRGNTNPTPEQRLAFLRSLAWWQWQPDEAGRAWDYIRGRLCG